MSSPVSNRPTIVIIGAGFGGLFAAKNLKKADANVIVIDRQNHHLFQPLLYQVATAGLSPSDIAWPIRGILRKQNNTTVLLDNVIDVDLALQKVLCENQQVDFDYLIIATGARHAYFGNDGWEKHAPGLKSIDDAVDIRRKILLAFEKAEMCTNAAERQRLLTFVIVGAGPTGVELAGTIAELGRRTLAPDFRRIDSRGAQVILLEAGEKVLPNMPEKLSAYAKRALTDLGVDVRLEHRVIDCNESGVEVSGEVIPAATILWGAGVEASPAGKWLGARTDSAGRVEVGPDLSLAEHINVFVIGDTASVKTSKGELVPGIAPAAKQQGKYVARLILSRLTGTTNARAFAYKHPGNLATIGRKCAVIDMPGFKLTGLVAWFIWVVAHIYFLIGVRGPLAVALKWVWQYLTYGRGARLITGIKHQKSD